VEIGGDLAAASADEWWSLVAISENLFPEHGDTDLVRQRGENLTPFKPRVRVLVHISFI
jgi:hypothetical protein